ncbi:pentapeptide repeat-containing protein [Bacillus subtilis]|uniref:pentapeptide repeat-containing protein n=1 Tax=Bacillus subtilis TaxID=1423 RepID=UPI0025C75B66|nr:pentapeptide repeat-containing protein [Bacillus subtilis]MEC2297173.1 pentapeptide repeat-containing protein [Bacillus subtilis]GLI90705.1 hypothetical protein ANABIO4_40570 [Bacillus subtilis]
MSKDKQQLKKMTQKELEEQLLQNKMFYEFTKNETSAGDRYGEAAYRANPADFSYRDLRGLEFPENAQLGFANFEGANLSGVRMISPKLRSSTFKDATLNNFIVIGGDINRADFENASLEKAVFEFVEGDNVSFKNANCKSMDLMLSGLDAKSVDFTGADTTNLVPSEKMKLASNEIHGKENTPSLYIDTTYLNSDVRYESKAIHTSEDFKRELLVLKQKKYEAGLNTTGFSLKELKNDYPDQFKTYIEQYHDDMTKIKDASPAELFDILSDEKGMLTRTPTVNSNDLRIPDFLDKDEALKELSKNPVDNSLIKLNERENEMLIKEFTEKEGIEYPQQDKNTDLKDLFKQEYKKYIRNAIVDEFKLNKKHSYRIPIENKDRFIDLDVIKRFDEQNSKYEKVSARSQAIKEEFKHVKDKTGIDDDGYPYVYEAFNKRLGSVERASDKNFDLYLTREHQEIDSHNKKTKRIEYQRNKQKQQALER